MKFRISPRLALVVIAAMFVLPLVAAWLMYNGTIDFKPGSTRNLGVLVRPALPMSWENGIEAVDAGSGESPVNEDVHNFREHWVILHAVAEPCLDSCVEAVTGIRQVHRAAGRNQGRIKIALLLPDNSPPAIATTLGGIYPSFQLINNPTGELWISLEQIARNSTVSESASGGTYLIDPLGNIMMYYAVGSDPNFLKKDLKRLLTWSKLDEQ